MRARHQYEETIPQYETALARNPNMAYPLHALRECKLMTGSIEEVIPLEKRAIRLNPLDGQIAGRYLADRLGASAAISHRRGDPMAREGTCCQSEFWQLRSIACTRAKLRAAAHDPPIVPSWMFSDIPRAKTRPD